MRGENKKPDPSQGRCWATEALSGVVPARPPNLALPPRWPVFRHSRPRTRRARQPDRGAFLRPRAPPNAPRGR